MSNITSIFSYAVPVIILLGLLIFVHELGHFLVAKYFKVRVEVFSLGFGKKLLSFRRGDTEYCVSAIPLGGYVKMFGDDPTAEVSSADRAVSFLHKNVWQRIAIVLAGPIMNLLFAVVLYAAIAMTGERTLSPVIGDITPKSDAAVAGFQAGDRVLEINQKPIASWSEIEKTIHENADKSLRFQVQRTNGSTEMVDVTPKMGPNPNVLEFQRSVGLVDGLTYSSRSATIAVADATSPAGKAGLKSGDAVTEIGSTQIRRWRELLVAAETAVQQPEVKIKVQRGLIESFENEKVEPQTVELTVAVPASAKNLKGIEALNALGLATPELYLASVEKDSPADKAGFKIADRIVSINGAPMESFEQVVAAIRSFDGEKPLQFAMMRAGQPTNLEVKPNVKKRMNHMGQEESRFEVGIRPMIIDDMPDTYERTSGNFLAGLERGVVRSMENSAGIVIGLVRLFQGEVSSKNVGGFLSIGQMAKNSWGMGATEFMLVMAMISLNLFILNLLPVPVLDGGHLVFYTIEAIRGAPLSMQKMEVAQRVGAAILVCLMVFALFNDVSRIFFR